MLTLHTNKEKQCVGIQSATSIFSTIQLTSVYFRAVRGEIPPPQKFSNCPSKILSYVIKYTVYTLNTKFHPQNLLVLPQYAILE